METSEHETIILLNQGDLAEGYFWFSTTKESIFNKLCNRIGGKDKILEVKVSHDCWNCKLPRKFWKGASMCIGKPRAISDSQRDALRTRGFKGRKAIKKENNI